MLRRWLDRVQIKKDAKAAAGATRFGFDALEPRLVPATITVDTLLDNNDGNVSAGNLSLREAIGQANNNAGDDTINFAPLLFADPQSKLTLTLGQLSLADVAGKTTIQGPTAVINGSNNSRIFQIAVGATVELSQLTLLNGSVSFVGDRNGGAINNEGTLTLDHVFISKSTATGKGGAIYNNGTLTILDSEITENLGGTGGGLESASGTVLIQDSTFYLNRATEADGGAILVNAGTAKIINSTLSSNTAINATGGGICNNADVTVINSTIVGNRSSNGGGIFTVNSANKKTTLLNTLLAGNTIGTDAPQFNDLSGKDVDPTSKNNLIATPTTTGGLVDGIAGNRVGNGTFPTQQLFLNQVVDVTPTRSNGSTFAHRLIPNSRAIDGGDTPSAVDAQGNPLPNDQLGQVRVSGISVDIGAAEFVLPAVLPDVELESPSKTSNRAPIVEVTAKSAGVALSANTPVAIDVDLNNDNDFADPGETNYAVNIILGSQGIAQFALAPALAVGNYKIRASVGGGVSSTKSLQIIAVPGIFSGFTDDTDDALAGSVGGGTGASFIFVDNDASSSQVVIKILLPNGNTRTFNRDDGYTPFQQGDDRTFVGDVDGDGVAEIIQFNRIPNGGGADTTPAYRVLNSTTGAVIKTVMFGDLLTGLGGSRTVASTLTGFLESEDAVFVGRFTQSANLEALFFNRTAESGDSLVVINLQTGAITDRGFHVNGNFGGWLDATDQITISDTNFDGFDDIVFTNRVADPQNFRSTRIGFVGMVSLNPADSGRRAVNADSNPRGSNIGFYRFFDWNFAKPGQASVFPGYDDQFDQATFGRVQNNGVNTAVIVLVNSEFDGNSSAAAYALLQPAQLVQGTPDSFQLISTQFRSAVPAASFEIDDDYFMTDTNGDGSDEFVSYSSQSSEVVLRAFGAFNGQIVKTIPENTNRPETVGPTQMGANSFTDVIGEAIASPSAPASTTLAAAVDATLAPIATTGRRYAVDQAIDEIDLL